MNNAYNLSHYYSYLPELLNFTGYLLLYFPDLLNCESRRSFKGT